MKSDTERKRFYKARAHQKTKRMHVHLSKQLRGKIKRKKRSLLLRKGDKVRIMRGPGKGKTVKVMRVSHVKMKVYTEGVVLRTAKGREVLRALQPSNLELVELQSTKERKELFSDAAFRKEEKKPEKKEEKQKVKVEKTTVEAEVVPEEKEAPKAEKAEASGPKTQNPKPETGKPETPKTQNAEPETGKAASKPEEIKNR